MPAPRAAAYFDQMRAAESLPALTDITQADMPPAVSGLAHLIGLPAALDLVDAFGGLTLRIPHGSNEQGRAILDLLASKIGQAAAQHIATMYGATQLYIPNCKPALLKVRNRQLLIDRNSLAVDGLSERDIVQCLARRYRISDRYVWEILKKPLDSPAPKQAQGSLFPVMPSIALLYVLLGPV